MSEHHPVSGEMQGSSVETIPTLQGDTIRERFDAKVEIRRRIKIQARRRAEMIARLSKTPVGVQS